MATGSSHLSGVPQFRIIVGMALRQQKKMWQTQSSVQWSENAALLVNFDNVDNVVGRNLIARSECPSGLYSEFQSTSHMFQQWNVLDFNHIEGDKSPTGNSISQVAFRFFICSFLTYFSRLFALKIILVYRRAGEQLICSYYAPFIPVRIFHWICSTALVQFLVQIRSSSVSLIDMDNDRAC